MSAALWRLWPASLAARLALLLLLALAFAQGALIVVLRLTETNVVEAVGHGQALTGTVALVRLLSLYPADQGDALTAAFGSRTTCAFVTSDAPEQAAMSEAERRLAAMIAPMLHGVKVGAAQAEIDATGAHAALCPGRKLSEPEGGALRGPERPMTVSMTVPLADGRWLTTRTAIEQPSGWNRTTFLSFVLSSLVAAGVAAAAVHVQTRSLRALADASERFGRGETVPPLATSGPTEVAAASRAFNTMQDRLSAYLGDRLRLLAGISHDLRTPLTTLRLKAEFVEDASVRDGIVATVDELATICEATLAFSRAEASSEPTREVDLAALAGDVVDEFNIAGEDVSLAPSPAHVAPCRPVALKRALRNLVQNAVRYGGGAKVSVEASREAVTIAVDDDGPGVPEDRMEEAFKPFVRLEPSRSADTGGLGLGLAIARSIVRAHGGELTLVNRAEGGLRASLVLPARAA